ncbi:hypothetical protein [Aeromicrobium sp.]|uniref:hypothetical protein n=1 Tax=Aeromicrobium sp. TaxID=1871063 RepID=UPI003D6C6865
MPTWVYGIGMAILLMLRPAILRWLFGFIRREVDSLRSVSAEQKLQRDAATAREAAPRGADDSPATPNPGDRG